MLDPALLLGTVPNIQEGKLWIKPDVIHSKIDLVSYSVRVGGIA